MLINSICDYKEFFFIPKLLLFTPLTTIVSLSTALYTFLFVNLNSIDV